MISYYSISTPEPDVFGATWLSKNEGNSSMIYADLVSFYNVLTSYGLIPRQRMDFVTNTTVLGQGNFLYLGQLNVVGGVITTDTSPFNTSELSPLLNENNRIYSNGNCEIWKAYLPG
jgi:uncharacterized membrane protein